MAHAWVEEFKQFHPKVTVEILGRWIRRCLRTAQAESQALVMLSRPVKKEELEQLKSATIVNPVAFVVAREALGVFVHASKPSSGDFW